MESRSRFFWIYSIILFLVAFFLIGFSAFTGVRYQEEKTAARQIYQGAQASVIELQGNLEALKKDNVDLKQQNVELKSEIENLQVMLQKAEEIKKLIKVQDLLNNKNKIDAKEEYEKIDSTLLEDEILSFYEKLKSIIY